MIIERLYFVRVQDDENEFKHASKTAGKPGIEIGQSAKCETGGVHLFGYGQRFQGLGQEQEDIVNFLGKAVDNFTDRSRDQADLVSYQTYNVFIKIIDDSGGETS